MSVNNSHQVSRYYDFYRDKEIVFTKANLISLRIDPRQVYVKTPDGQWPCIINSVSLMNAKMQEDNFMFGGEYSGHIYYRDKWFDNR